MERIISSVFSSLQPEVRESVISLAENLTSLVSKTNLEDLGQLMEYQGFDPAKTIMKMHSLWKKHDAAKKMVKAGEKEYPIVSESLGEDLLFFTFLFITRGSNLSKIIARSKEEFKELLSERARAYGIPTKRNSPGTTYLATDIITIPRIANCVPFLGVNLYQKGHGKILVKGFDSVPLGWRNNLFPSMIPTSELAEWCYIYAYELDKVITRGSKTTTDRIMQFANAAITNKFIQDSHRWDFFTEHKWAVKTTDGYALTEASQAIATKAKALWNRILASEITSAVEHWG